MRGRNPELSEISHVGNVPFKNLDTLRTYGATLVSHQIECHLEITRCVAFSMWAGFSVRVRGPPHYGPPARPLIADPI